MAHQPPGADGLYRFDVVASQIGADVAHSGDLQRKAAAPFLATQRGKVLAGAFQDLDKALGHAIHAGIQGPDATYEIDGLRTYFAFQALGDLRPCSASRPGDWHCPRPRCCTGW